MDLAVSAKKILAFVLMKAGENGNGKSNSRKTNLDLRLVSPST